MLIVLPIAEKQSICLIFKNLAHVIGTIEVTVITEATITDDRFGDKDEPDSSKILLL